MLLSLSNRVNVHKLALLCSFIFFLLLSLISNEKVFAFNELNLPISPTGIINEFQITNDVQSVAFIREEETLCNGSWGYTQIFPSFNLEENFGCGNPAIDGIYDIVFSATTTVGIYNQCYINSTDNWANASWEECLDNALYKAHFTRSNGVWYSSSTIPYSSSTPVLCDTCTRIIASVPSFTEPTIFNATGTHDFTVQYYVAESDYNEDDTYIDISYGSYTNNDGKRIKTYTFDTTDFNTTQYANILNALHEYEGTYFFTVEMYSKPWYLFGGKENFFYQSVSYDVATKTLGNILTQTAIEQDEDAFASFMTDKGCETILDFTPRCIMWAGYFLVVPDAEPMANRIKSSLDLLMSRPPIGYGYIVVKTLYGATDYATSTLTMSITIPAELPAGGTTISLPIGAGISQAIETINNNQVDSIDGEPFAKFMSYWTAMWYIVFFIWLIGEIFGVFGVDFANEKVSPYHERKRQNNLKRRNNNMTIIDNSTYDRSTGKFKHYTTYQKRKSEI